MAKAASRSARFTKEVDLANVFNNADSSTETSADGSNLASTHTLWNAATKSNLVTTDLGVASAQTMFDHFASLTDDRGLRISVKPKYITINPAMKWVVGEVFGSKLKPYTTDNEKNMLADESITPVEWAEITDTDAWCVTADPADVDGLCLRIYDRKGYEVSNDFKIDNTTMLSVIRWRYSRGAIDWRGFYKSTGA